ncbi:MAG TPA: winged helix-turn-helix domain-containing protein [Streptosporangiaceae bacterium]|nr:winged helix-turn-helix domain-containing protein [Streptosporangiaceae bacterium]
MADAMPPVRTTDPKALRALAHPIRWKLIDVLASEGTATVTRCAERLGESTATCSYHLGILAKYGYIERAAGQGRDKPWQLVSSDLDLSASGLDPEQARASRAAADAFLDYEFARLKQSLHESDREPEEWQHAHKVMGATAWVTATEFQEMAAEVQRVMDSYAGHGRDLADRGAGAREVRLFAAVTLARSSPRGGQ